MLIIRFGGNAKKGINGELQSIAGPMVQDVHIVWERLLLKPTLLLENIESGQKPTEEQLKEVEEAKKVL